MARRPDGALRLHHLGTRHPDRVTADLDHMHETSDIAPVAAEAAEGVEEDRP